MQVFKFSVIAYDDAGEVSINKDFTVDAETESSARVFIRSQLSETENANAEIDCHNAYEEDGCTPA